jgi:hypothetical protein
MSKLIEKGVALGLSAGLLAGCSGSERGNKIEDCLDGFSTDIETTYDEVAKLEALADSLVYGGVADPTNKGMRVADDVNETGEISCTKDGILFLTTGGLLLQATIENSENN